MRHAPEVVPAVPESCTFTLCPDFTLVGEKPVTLKSSGGHPVVAPSEDEQESSALAAARALHFASRECTPGR